MEENISNQNLRTTNTAGTIYLENGFGVCVCVCEWGQCEAANTQTHLEVITEPVMSKSYRPKHCLQCLKWTR